MFDLNGSKVLERGEVEQVVQDVFGQGSAHNSHLELLLRRMDRNQDGIVTYDEFVAFHKRYPAILFPAFTVQQQLRRRTFGACVRVEPRLACARALDAHAPR